ncbi:MAG TPA: hypothetical protein VE548_05240 [Nitrososphaeraceae archaeon]|nr:hypothetical protein [Nitrososphaeraceae archaeon]
MMQSSKIGAKQKYGEIEENPIGLPQKYCKTIVNQLNEDIASSYILFLQLRKQHAIIKGIIFEYEEMADRLEHYLAMESLERNLTTR